MVFETNSMRISTLYTEGLLFYYWDRSFCVFLDALPVLPLDSPPYKAGISLLKNLKYKAGISLLKKWQAKSDWVIISLSACSGKPIIKCREGDGLNASDEKDEQALRWIGSTMQELEIVGWWKGRPGRGKSVSCTYVLDGYVPPCCLLDIPVLLRTSSRFPARLLACDFLVGVRFVEKIRWKTRMPCSWMRV